MNKTKDLIINALNYYDINNEKYSQLFDKIKYSQIVQKTSNDLEHNKIIFYDENKKEIFRSRYEVMGMYHFESKLWIWGWSMPTLQKKETTIAKKILNYGIDLQSEDELFLKSQLITSRFRIIDVLQLDIYKAIVSYISKNPLILQFVRPHNGDDIAEFIKEIDNRNPIVYFLYLLDGYN